MAHGQPDFGVYAQKATVYASPDAGELAARLGSIVTYDRRGDVILLDDFESPVLKWQTTVAGVGYVRLDNSNVKSFSQALRLHSAAAAGPSTAIYKTLFTLISRRLGLELHLSKLANTYYIFTHIYHYDGTNRLTATVGLYIAAGELRVTTTGGAETVLATGLTFPSEDFCFIPLKIVADFSTGMYVRVLFGNIEYDASTIPLWSSVADGVARDVIGTYLTNDFTATDADLWVEDIILTQDEI